MWRDVAPLLARQFTVIAADLPGYGKSGCPPSAADHAPYSKRAIGKAMAAVMSRLGFDRFAVAGHDRGARVAYRMALDRPQAIDRLIVMDIVPTAEAWERADADFALAFWPWSLLAQDPPLPERLVSAEPEAVIDSALSTWGSDPAIFPDFVRSAYAQSLRDPARVHAICEEYRAAATIDRRDDEADRLQRRRILCPALVLWSGSGPLGSWYASEGGPLAIWENWADQVEGEAMEGGHFFPEENPEAVSDRIARFLSGANPLLTTESVSRRG